MTGFKGNQAGGDISNHVTPIQDKSAILGSKPFLGVNKKGFGRSPDNVLNQTPLTYKSSNMSEMKLQFGAQAREVDDEIQDQHDANNNSQRFVTDHANGEHLEESKQTVDPNDTCTSDFYNIPGVGGAAPVKLTIENQRRPFTPPFAQLVKV